MEMNLIYYRAHHYARITGECFEDLVQEGGIASLEAELSFDPSYNTKLTTWIWWQIERRLKRYCDQTRRITYTDSPPDYPGYDVIEFLEFVDSVPSDVQGVCRMVLTNPQRYAGIGPRKCRQMLKQDLRDQGWSQDQAHEAIQDSKYWFTNTSPDMRRTVPV